MRTVRARRAGAGARFPEGTKVAARTAMTRALSFLAVASLALVTALAACSADSGDVPRGPSPAAPEDAANGPVSPAPESEAGALPPAPPVDAGPDGASPPKNYDRGSSAGCGKANAGTGLQTRSMTIAGKARSYLRFVPPGYQPNVPLAVVFGLHGSGGTSEKARAIFELEAKAGGKAIFVYPQGLPDPAFDDANRWITTKGSEDFAFLSALIAEVEASHCVDQDRIFVSGFSDGARMTSMVGCFLGDVVRAIAPVAPGGTATTLPLAGCVGEVGIWEGLGNDDVDHEPGATRVRDYYRAANGCAATRTITTPAGCETYDGCRGAVPAVWCTYPGGHAWPPIGAAGVWSFFASFK